MLGGNAVHQLAHETQSTNTVRDLRNVRSCLFPIFAMDIHNARWHSTISLGAIDLRTGVDRIYPRDACLNHLLVLPTHTPSSV